MFIPQKTSMMTSTKRSFSLITIIYLMSNKIDVKYYKITLLTYFIFTLYIWKFSTYTIFLLFLWLYYFWNFRKQGYFTFLSYMITIIMYIMSSQFFVCLFLICFCFFFTCFWFYFIFKFYIIVLVLPNIKMNLPQAVTWVNWVLTINSNI